MTTTPDTDQLELCIKCKWCEEVEGEFGVGHVCKHPVSESDKGGPKRGVDMVTGKELHPFDRYRACGTMRSSNMCGENAKLFEPKI